VKTLRFFIALVNRSASNLSKYLMQLSSGIWKFFAADNIEVVRIYLDSISGPKSFMRISISPPEFKT